MGGILISKKVEAVKDSITSEVIHNWSNSRGSYSGDWNTCSSVGKRIKLAEKAGKVTKKQLKEIEEIVNNLEKGDSVVIDMGVIGYDVITMKKEAKKATAKFEKVYAVYDTQKVIKTFKTQKEAFDFAEKESLKRGMSLGVEVRMEQVSGTSELKLFKVTRTRKAKKPTRKNVNFQEIHQYRVYGWASC